MPRFRIHCSTVNAYWLTVEAPSEEAAERYYEGSDRGNFHSGEEGCWSFDEVELLLPEGDDPTDVEVDEDGEVIAPATKE